MIPVVVVVVIVVGLVVADVVVVVVTEIIKQMGIQNININWYECGEQQANRSERVSISISISSLFENINRLQWTTEIKLDNIRIRPRTVDSLKSAFSVNVVCDIDFWIHH